MTNKTAKEILESFRNKNDWSLSDKDIISAMNEYMEQECDKIVDLFTRPLEELKPLEDLWRKENSPNKFIVPDARKFYKWIVSKIIK